MMLSVDSHTILNTCHTYHTYHASFQFSAITFPLPERNHYIFTLSIITLVDCSWCSDCALILFNNLFFSHCVCLSVSLFLFHISSRGFPELESVSVNTLYVQNIMNFMCCCCDTMLAPGEYIYSFQSNSFLTIW